MFKKKVSFIFLLIPCLLPALTCAALESNLETVNCSLVKGWIWNAGSPATRLKVDIVDVTTVTPIKLATLTSDMLRGDLLSAGKGDGKYGFMFVLPASIRNTQVHKLAVRLSGTTTELSNSPKSTSTCYPKLNDTGISGCSNATSNGLTCPSLGYARQDGDYGRDALARKKLLYKAGAGNAGFDFTKIANDGSKLPASALLGSGSKDWACTLDNLTGLMWEIKTDDGGLRDKDNTYSWYDSDNTRNGGFVGYHNQGTCGGNIFCDTQTYASAINKLKLCGRTDWRVPDVSELISIVDYSREHIYSYDASVDGTYFPNSATWWYIFWTSSPYAYNSNAAYVVFFNDPYIGNYQKNSDLNVRLVRGKH